jgi:hypothetical protein
MLAQLPTPPVAVSFADLPRGWRQSGTLGLDGFATSWPYNPGPRGWAAAIPVNGIVVQVFFVRDNPPHPPLELRLPATTRFALDGAPDVREYRISGRIRGHNVEVWADIRSRSPSRRLLRTAQRVVSALRFR